MKSGAVVLPGLDLDLPAHAWDAIDDQHPQAGMRRVLQQIGATRDDVRPSPAIGGAVPAGRVRLLRRALLPAKALDWGAPSTASAPTRDEKPRVQLLLPLPLESPRQDISRESLPYRLETADQQEEAVAIALILREALETPGRRACLVTPDRDLARRVAAELLRFWVVADDSAGEPLAEAPPAVFLRLLVRAIVAELAPVPLLALLKHPLAAAGLSPPACRARARTLERLCLRGPRPLAGLTGLRVALDRRSGKAAIRGWPICWRGSSAVSSRSSALHPRPQRRGWYWPRPPPSPRCWRPLRRWRRATKNPVRPGSGRQRRERRSQRT